MYSCILGCIWTYIVVVSDNNSDWKEEVEQCEGFIRHKKLTCTPEWLVQNGVKVFRIVQHPGQYVIVRPGVLHFGFNTGDNLAEAANFALKNHLSELKPISRDYKYDECCSGLRRGRDDFEPNAGYCQAGHDSGVVQISLKDTQELVDDEAPPQTLDNGKKTLGKVVKTRGKVSKNSRLTVGAKRSGTHLAARAREPSPKRAKQEWLVVRFMFLLCF